MKKQNRIVLISCVSKKLSKPSKAKALYISTLFKLNLQYARKLQPDAIYILSAKHGLLSLDQIIEPYEQTLNNMASAEIKKWADQVLKQINEICKIDETEFTFLAGDKYRKYLLPYMNNSVIPLEGLPIGKQLQKLKGLVAMDNNCVTVHRLANKLERHQFPFDESKIPLNGIYILFQKGEAGHQQDRIVRIGTHTGDKQLRPRMKQHFLNENKDRSIFRKNIGRALLNKENDPFLKFWEIDLTTRKAREKHAATIDFEYQKTIEKKVSQYIRENFSFVTFRVPDKGERLEIESKLISTVSRCNECGPSESWLGNSSPKVKIAQSGLWLVNELYKTPFDAENLERFKNLMGQ